MRTKRPSRSSSLLPADVLSVLPVLDIDVDKIRGAEAWAICPGHEAVLGRRDNSASWSINVETGEHNCFSCGWGGNFEDLVAWQNGWDRDPDRDEQSRAWIRKHGGIAAVAARMRGEREHVRKRAEEVSEADLVFYDDPPRYALRDRDLSLASCRAYGVKYDLDKDRWIIPIREPFTERLMGWQIKGEGYFNNHPEHVEKSLAVFGHALLRKVREGYLEESPLDATRLHTYSLDGAVSGFGVHVSPTQMDLIVDEVDDLYVCLDNDDAGRKKSVRLWKEYRHRTRLHFANYEHTDLKDHGEMSPEEIEESLVKAYSSRMFGRLYVDR